MTHIKFMLKYLMISPMNYGKVAIGYRILNHVSILSAYTCKLLILIVNCIKQNCIKLV